MHKYLFDSYFLFFPICMQMWNCWIIRLFYVSFFERLPYCFPQRLHHFTSQPAVHKCFSFSTSSSTFTSFFFFFFDGSHPNGYVVLICILLMINDGSMVKNLSAKAGDAGNTRFDALVGKIPQSRKWQPSLVFLPENFLVQSSLEGCNP